jgi:glucose-1-phosphate adenylyltransferase
VGSPGILQAADDGRITRFVEKPTDPKVIDELAAPRHMIQQAGVSEPERAYFASMGIYVFKAGMLEELLGSTSPVDFGKEIIPDAIRRARVFAFPFGGYWEDIGTIGAFYRANLALASVCPPFDFYNEEQRVFTHPRFLPGSKVNACHIRQSILSDGCIVDDAEIEEAIVGVRSVIRAGVTIRRSVLMGADYFESDSEKAENRRLGRPDVGIGPGCTIENTIIDKNARIGAGVTIRNEKKLPSHDGAAYYVRDGIVVVPKDATISEKTAI